MVSAMSALKCKEEKPVQWMLTLFYDAMREDGSTYVAFEDAFKKNVSIKAPLMDVFNRTELDPYTADKAAWLFSSLVVNVPRFFEVADVEKFLDTILSNGSISDLGKLEAITNVLKGDAFRALVYSKPGIHELVFNVCPKTASSPFLYKCVFAMWMFTYDESVMTQIARLVVIKVKDILMHSRVEKVVRLCLTVLRNFLKRKDGLEDSLKQLETVHEAVQQLEYEKWRDTDLYDEIREVAEQISTDIHEQSNFDMYQRELKSGSLKWGFVHSSKFWAENFMKFEENGFEVLKTLRDMLIDSSTDATTLAIACHDFGEFVALHPMGKRKAAQLGVKARVMELMGSSDAAHREVRREALMCCQKIMLNKWQDMEKAK
jgi:V-type H+-transporting ATPase subunit H